MALPAVYYRGQKVDGALEVVPRHLRGDVVVGVQRPVPRLQLRRLEQDVVHSHELEPSRDAAQVPHPDGLVLAGHPALGQQDLRVLGGLAVKVPADLRRLRVHRDALLLGGLEVDGGDLPRARPPLLPGVLRVFPALAGVAPRRAPLGGDSKAAPRKLPHLVHGVREHVVIAPAEVPLLRRLLDFVGVRLVLLRVHVVLAVLRRALQLKS